MHTIGQHPHILGIDHSPEILGLVEGLLEEEMFRITILSRSGKTLTAIALLAPDLIIMDYRWSHSDKGWALLTLLTMDPRTQAIPVILCTAAVPEVRELQEHLMSVGIRVVQKPCVIEHLLRVIAEVLDRGISGEPVT